MTCNDSDPVKAIWSSLYVGDSYEKRTLIVDANGSGTITAHLPDGRSTTRVVRIAGREVEVAVPSTTEVILASEPSLTLLATTFAEGPKDESVVESYRPKETGSRTLGTVAEYLLERAGEDQWLAAISRGEDHPCQRCDGSGWAYPTTCACVTLLDEHSFTMSDPDSECPLCLGSGENLRICDRCAGTGLRRSRAAVEFWPEDGEVLELVLDANDFDVTQTTFRANSWIEGQTREWTETFVDAQPVRELLAEHGFLTGDVVILETAGKAGRFAWRTTCTQGADGVAKAFLKMLPRGTHPDLGAGPEPLTASEAERERQECSWDHRQRVASRRVRVRPDRTASAAVDELLSWSLRLEEALEDGWRVQLWCNTGFIATGEHGPQITLCALSPDAQERPIGIVGEVTYDLSDALETVVARVRHVDVEAVAQRLRAR